MSEMKYASVNYVNPMLAPKDPRVPLKTGLGGVLLQSVDDSLLTHASISSTTTAAVDEEAPSYMVSMRKKLHNGRSHQFNLKHDGFELLSNVQLPLRRPTTATALADSEFHDARARLYGSRQVAVPLAIRLLRDRFGLSNVFAWHFVPPFVRQAASTNNEGLVDHNQGSVPHAMAHNDYGLDYFRVLQHQDPDDRFLGITNATKSRQLRHDVKRAGRILVLQFWMSAQPEGTCIQNDSLAICRPSSICVSDLVTRPLPVYDGISTYKGAAVLQAKDSPRHEWFWWPNMTSHECLVWVGYDSAWGDEAKPALHSSFHHDGGIPGDSPRQSIEFRVILLLDPQSKL